MTCAVTCTIIRPDETPDAGARVSFVPLSPIPIGQGGAVQVVAETFAVTDENGVCVVEVAPDDYAVLIRSRDGPFQEAIAAAVPDDATANLEDLTFVPGEQDRIYAAFRAAQEAAEEAETARDATIAARLYDFDTLADLQAYSGDAFPDGAVIRVRQEGFSYTQDDGLGSSQLPVAAAGVKLRVQPVQSAIDWRAFGVTPGAAGAQNDAILRFAENLTAGVRGVMTGTVNIDAPLNLTFGSNRLIDAECTFVTLNASDEGVVLAAGFRTQVNGSMRLTCGPTGEGSYSSRRQVVGWRVAQGGRARIHALEVTGTLRDGIVIQNGTSQNVNISSIEYTRANFCGGSFWTATPVSIENTGSPTSSAQRSVFVFESPVPEYLAENDVLIMNGEHVLVASVSTDRLTVACYFGLRDTTIGTVRFCVGAGVRNSSGSGANSNVVQFGTIDAVDVGVGMKQFTLLGGTVRQIHTTGRVGVVLGRPISNAHSGSFFGNIYVEGAGQFGRIHLLEVSTGIRSAMIGANNGGATQAYYSKLRPTETTSFDFIERTSFQSFGRNDTIEFQNVRIGGFGSNRLGQRILRGGASGSTRYLLLCRRAQPNIFAACRVVGARNTGSEGRVSAQFDLFIAGRSDGDDPTIHWSVKSRAGTQRLVDCEYDGERWLAIDTGGTSSGFRAFENALIDGYYGQLALEWVSSGVSDVQDVQTGFVNRTGQITRMPALQLVSPDGTVWTVTVDDTGTIGVA